MCPWSTAAHFDESAETAPAIHRLSTATPPADSPFSTGRLASSTPVTRTPERARPRVPHHYYGDDGVRR
jgi:hypothetical protein